MKTTDVERLARISEVGHKLLAYIAETSLTQELLSSSETIQWTVTTPLYEIGEQANHISDSFVAKHPDLPLISIAGLRHRLVHDYGSTNWKMIGEILFEELEEFIEEVDRIICDEEK